MPRSSDPPAQSLFPGTNGARAVLTGTLLLGFLLRALISPRAPVHANNHGFEEIRALVEYSWRAAGQTGPYGSTFFVVMNGLLSVFGKNERTLFLLNQLFGTLAVLGLYLLAKALRFSERGAVFAALLLCLSPAQVWLSGTESQMALHLCLATAGLGILVAAVRRASPLLLWPAAALIALSAAMHVPTVVLLPVAAAFAFSTGIVRVMREDRRFRNHAFACFVLSAIGVVLHALSFDRDSLSRGIGVLGVADNLAAWATPRNILWDPTLTPVVLAPLALAGAIMMYRRRSELARPLLFAAVLMVPLSFTVCACRTDALRYQAPVFWIYYLLAAFPFSGAAPTAKGASRDGVLFWGAVLLLGASAVPGLRLLAKGSEEIQEYRFMREVAAAVPPSASLWLPTRTKAEHLQTEFPDYLREQFVIKGDEPDPFPGRGRWLYVGLDCYKTADEESPEDALDPASGLRKECVSACAGSRELVMRTTLDARPPGWGYQRPFYRLSAERPVAALFRCAEKSSAPPRASARSCGEAAKRDEGMIHFAVRQSRERGAARRALAILGALEEPCPSAELLLSFAEGAARRGDWDDCLAALELAGELDLSAEQRRRAEASRSAVDAHRAS